MFSLHRDKWRDDSTAKPSTAECLGRKKQYCLLQLFKHCYRLSWYRQDLGKDLQLLFVLLSNGAVNRDKRLSGSLDTKAHVSTLHFSGLQHSHSAPTSVLWAHRALLTLSVCTQTCIWHPRLPYNSGRFLHVSARKILKQMGKDSI